jgi:hypothetical protein
MYYKNAIYKIQNITDEDEYLLELFRLISIYHFEYNAYPYNILFIVIMKERNKIKIEYCIKLFRELSIKTNNESIFEFYLNSAFREKQNNKLIYI